jgi:hypothetical protein
MPLVWISALAMPALASAAISPSILAALSFIAWAAVGALVWTPVPMVATSGAASTLSVTFNVTTGAVSAMVTLVWATAATGSAAAPSAIRARADFMDMVSSVSPAPVFGRGAMNGRCPALKAVRQLSGSTLAPTPDRP